MGTFRTSGPGDSISRDPEWTSPKRGEEEPSYIEVLQQRADSLNIKRLLVMKENQISQVKEFRAFLCMGWRGKWQPTPVFLPGESQGQKILVGLHESWGHRESDGTRRLNRNKTACLGRCKSLTSLKSSLSCTSPLSSQYPVFHILSSLGAYCREWLQPDIS